MPQCVTESKSNPLRSPPSSEPIGASEASTTPRSRLSGCGRTFGATKSSPKADLERGDGRGVGTSPAATGSSAAMATVTGRARFRRRRRGLLVLALVRTGGSKHDRLADSPAGLRLGGPIGNVESGDCRGRAGLAGLVGGERLGIAGKRLAVGGNVQGLAVGEDADELLAGHPRPVAHRTGVHVDEGRAGGRVEADAADLHPEADRPQGRQRHAGDEEIHRLAVHVLAVLGNAPRTAAEHAVGLRRAVAAHDVDVIAGAALAVHLPDQIHQLRIHPGRLVFPPVAENVVDLGKAGGIVAAVALEDDDRLLVGVDVHELEGALLGGGCAGKGEGADKRRSRREQAKQ